MERTFAARDGQARGGATGGLVFNMIEVSALLQHVSPGEADVDGTTQPDSEAGGWVPGIRAESVVVGGGMQEAHDGCRQVKLRPEQAER